MISESLVEYKRQRKNKGAAIVYVIAANDSGPVKIGISRDIVARLLALQPGNPFRLRCYSTWDTAKPGKLEYAAHRRFGAHRLQGEWFQISVDEAEAFLALNGGKQVVSTD